MTFSQAADNNKGPILEILKLYLNDGNNILEIGSGTGQHAVFIAEKMPAINWQTADLPHNHEGIKQRLNEFRLANVYPPMALDVKVKEHWPTTHYDVIYSANTAHIMSWEEVQLMLEMVGASLATDGLFILYGPFNVAGNYTSASNANFDAMLKARHQHMGLRDIDSLKSVAATNNLSLLRIHEMPANNKILVFKNIR